MQDRLRLQRSTLEPSRDTLHFTKGAEALAEGIIMTLAQGHTVRFEVFSSSCFFLRKELGSSHIQGTIIPHSRQGSWGPESKRVRRHTARSDSFALSAGSRTPV